MAFVTVEDLYGPTEVIVFENCYQNCSNLLMEDNIISMKMVLCTQDGCK